MIERIQSGFELAWILALVLSGLMALALGLAASWFVFQPFKWLEAGLRKGVRHG